MIKTKEDLKFYLEQDAIANGEKLGGGQNQELSII